MALAEFLKQLDELVIAATAAFDAVADEAALETARVEFVGAKKGRMKTMQKLMGAVDAAERPAAGKRLNEVKAQIEAAFAAAQGRLGTQTGRIGPGPVTQFDPTLPGRQLRVGRLHPITQTIEELKGIMGRLGFSVAEGPEIEDEWHNFEALNIPLEHPARDPLDKFYLSVAGQTAGTLLLRSQTSTVQIRVMEQTPPPVRVISLGRVYRPDTADATHYPMFHQMEGLLVDERVTMADLKSVCGCLRRAFSGVTCTSGFVRRFSRSRSRVSRRISAGTISGSSSVEPGMVDPTCCRPWGTIRSK